PRISNPLPALQRLCRVREAHTDAGVDGDTAGCAREHRIQVELRDLGEIFGEPCQAFDEIPKGSSVGGRCSAEAANEPAGLAAEHELTSIRVGDRRYAERCAAD